MAAKRAIVLSPQNMWETLAMPLTPIGGGL